MWRAVLTVSAFAVAMAHVETMIVVYLRRLYYPEGFRFPLVIIDTPTLVLELEREAATLVMLAAYGIAAGRTRAGKTGQFPHRLRRLGHLLLRVAQDRARLAGFAAHLGRAVPHPGAMGRARFGARQRCLHDDRNGAGTSAPGATRRRTGSGIPRMDGPSGGLPHHHRVIHDRRAAAAAGPRRPAQQVDSDDLPLVDAGPRAGGGHWRIRPMGATRIP